MILQQTWAASVPEASVPPHCDFGEAFGFDEELVVDGSDGGVFTADDDEDRDRHGTHPVELDVEHGSGGAVEEAG